MSDISISAGGSTYTLHLSKTILILVGVATGLTFISFIQSFSPVNLSRPSRRNVRSRATTSSPLRSQRRRRRRERERERSAERDGGDTASENAEGGAAGATISAEDEDPDMGALGSLFSDSKEENHNLLNLLYAIAEDQSRKEGYIHRGITCNKCRANPIKGLRYKCANCVDFDLCETCESAENHIKAHVFLKIRIPIPPLANPRSALLPVFYPGKEVNYSSLNWDKLRELQKKTHFDQVELEALYEQFKSLATVEPATTSSSDSDDTSTTEGGIDRETFERCLGPLGLEKNLITERIFAFFDQDGDGIINFSELVCGLSIMCKGTLEEKIKYAFKGYDLDGDDFISRAELTKMFKAYFYLSMELVRDVVKGMEEDMMEGFEFQPSQPVSAAFTAAIPSVELEDEYDEMDSEEALQREERREERRRSSHRFEKRRDPFLEGSSGSGSSDGKELGEDDETANVSATPTMSGPASYIVSPSSSSTFSIESATSQLSTPPSPTADFPQQQQQQEQEQSMSHPQHPHDMNMLSSISNSQIHKTITSQSTWPEKFPVMESMSQEAIEEMVDKTFKAIETKRDGYISFDEFKAFVHNDSNIVSWFEALGTVF